MERSTLFDRLDDRLDTDAYADLDASPNGLQVGSREGGADRVAFAVDGVRETAEAAVEWGADVLVVHHGVIWGGLDRVTGRPYERIEPLIANDVALYVSHLPLDGHQELGNAAGLSELLGLENRAPFGELGDQFVGQRGTAMDPYDPDALRERLATELDTGGSAVDHLDFGPDAVADVGIVTGAGGDWLDEADAKGLDALVTGESKARLYHEAREAGIHVYLAGHYATETVGVRALQSLVDEWGAETRYLDVPTGL